MFASIAFMDRSSHRARVLRYGNEVGARVDDQLAAEEPLEIRVGGTPLTVMMRTPGSERELALGFLFGEGIIRAADDVAATRVIPNGEHPDLQNVLDVELAAGAPGVDRRWQRNFLSATSCGLCGVSTIEAIHQAAPPLPDNGFTLDPEVIYGLDARLRAEQEVFARTGGLHAAGLFTAEGEPLAVREDIGRHNAVDKVIGWAFLQDRLPLGGHAMLVSGRGGFEIVQKAIVAGLPVVASVSAPSSLAVQLARELRQTLIGFLRGRRFVIYAGEERVAKA
jgi:FdhD protein